MPTLLYRFMRPGLIWNMDDRDLDLTETRDMLLGSRRRRQKNVSEGSNYDDIKFDQERHHRKNSKSEKEERKMLDQSETIRHKNNGSFQGLLFSLI